VSGTWLVNRETVDWEYRLIDWNSLGRDTDYSPSNPFVITAAFIVGMSAKSDKAPLTFLSSVTPRSLPKTSHDKTNICSHEAFSSRLHLDCTSQTCLGCMLLNFDAGDG
jgi:hypothetical protein